MSTRSRPPDHPLVEFFHDLRDGLAGALARPELTTERAEVLARCRDALGAIRRLVDAVDDLVVSAASETDEGAEKRSEDGQRPSAGRVHGIDVR